MEGTYEPDLGSLLEAPVNLDFSGGDPRVLIIHTHTTESYNIKARGGDPTLLRLPDLGPGVQHDSGRGRQ